MPRSPSRSRSRSCSASSSSGYSSRSDRARRRLKRPNGVAKLSKSFHPAACFDNLEFLSWCSAEYKEAPASLSDSALKKRWKKFVKRWNSGKLSSSSYSRSISESGQVIPAKTSHGLASATSFVHAHAALNPSSAPLIGPSAMPKPSSSAHESVPLRKGPMLPPSDVNLEDLSKQTQSYIEHMEHRSLAAHHSSDDDVAGPLPEGLEPERRVISSVQDSKRESWMTQLPEGRRAPTTTVFANAFSQRGVRDAGDTSEWTETPQQRAAKLARPNKAVISSSSRPVDACSTVPDLVAQYNAATRPKTLMEIHQEQVKKGFVRDDEETEKRKDLEKTTGIRFFDRDKDLQVQILPSACIVQLYRFFLSDHLCRVLLGHLITQVYEKRLSKWHKTSR
jgi:hypothetical protein